MTIPQPLWRPTQERIRSSRLYDYVTWLQTKDEGASLSSIGQDISSHYEQLHQWSVTHKEDFWSSLWDYFDIKGDKGGKVLENGAAMPGAQWFPESSLNFAENLLQANANDIALIECGEDGRRNVLTYGDLKQQAAALAAYLGSCGVEKGDRVAAFLPNSHYAVVGMLATASLGAIWSSCSPDFGLQGVVDRFAQIQPKVLIACDGYFYGGKAIDTRERVDQIVSALDSLNKVIIAPYRNLESTPKPLCIPWPDALSEHQDAALQFTPCSFSDPLYILYSSGTTGTPKCIVHSLGGTLLQHLKELALHSDVNSTSTLFYYTTCGWMMWNWLVSGLALGASLVIYDGSPFHPTQSILFDIAERESIDVFGASAKYYAACEKYGLKPAQSHELSALRTLLSTGSPLSHESFDYIYRDIKHDLCVSSISGGTDIVSCFALGNPVLPVYKGELQCSGLGMDLDFFNDEAQSLVTGKGELVCKQAFPSMPIGFWNDYEGNKYHAAYFSRFPNTWAHGDYGEFIPHQPGDTLEQRGIIIHGRSDAVLNPGGVRIGTAEIYRQVEKIDAVFESIAIGQQWEDDVRVVLFVRLKDGLQLDEALTQEIRTVIRQNTTPRHVPAKIIQVPDIPRTLSGKLVELAVRDIVHGQTVKNQDALANPDALQYFSDLEALKT